jgi:hypothetical protein
VQLPLVLLVMPALYLVIGRASRPLVRHGT